MRQSPELKPNIWDGLVVLVILALAMFAALAVWRGTDSGSAPLVTVTADGTELDRFAPEALLDSPRSYSHNGYTLTVAAERDGASPCRLGGLPHTGLCAHWGHLPKRTEHHLPPRPHRHHPHRRRGGFLRRGRCDRLGGPR